MKVVVVGGGLAGCEAALQLARHGVSVRLIEMRPVKQTLVHATDHLAELVCSNSFKSQKPQSAAGMLKHDLRDMNSELIAIADKTAVAAGGALAVDRHAFSLAVEKAIEQSSDIEVLRAECKQVYKDGSCLICDELDQESLLSGQDATILATGPLTSDDLAGSLQELTGHTNLAFFDAAAPIVMADSLDHERLFAQSRYEQGAGDYLNAFFSKQEYEVFIEALLEAKRVIAKDFESKDLFQACQPIEEIARKGFDAPRFGPLKPVGLRDPRTDRRPWAAVQLRREDAFGNSYNLVGFQTNLTFPEQKRIFRMIPGLEQAEFSRYGVMHRNTFINAPGLLGRDLSLQGIGANKLYIAGQLSGTEGYTEAIASGLWCALSICAKNAGFKNLSLPEHMVFGALLAYASSKDTKDYQPMHVNFGIIEPLDPPVKNKQLRMAAYAQRSEEAKANFLAIIRTFW